MLERSTSCIEPASQIFLRSLESPVRSHRLLGPKFWKNGGDELAVPLWWPLYLDSVRQIPHRSNGYKQAPITKLYQPNENLFVDQQIKTRDGFKSKYVSHTSASSIRAFSNSKQDSQLPQAYDLPTYTIHNLELQRNNNNAKKSLTKDRVNRIRDGNNKEEIKDTESDTSFVHLKKEDSRVKQQRLERLLQPGEHKSYNHTKAWMLFVALPDQQRYTSKMLEFLSCSSRAIDLERALRCFAFISQTERISSDYTFAIRVAIRLRRYSTARRINLEATSRQLGRECGQILLSSLLKQGLWKNAAKVWQTIYDHEGMSNPNNRRRKDFNATSWSIIDEMADLPIALSLLSSRLLDEDPVLATEFSLLKNMAHDLLTRIFKSVHIMGVITPRGILRLLSKHQKLGILKPTQHFEALHTLHEMRKARNRAETAILIFRNLRFSHPHSVVPKAIYGLLISTCADADYPPQIFNYLLDEFSQQHGMPDKAAYQRVMTALARQGDINNVQQQFDQLVKYYGQPRNLAHFSPLLYACARRGDVEGTKQQFERIRSFKLVPNTHCWNILIYAHAKSQTPEIAFNVFAQMKKAGIRPDAYTFGTLLGIASNIGDMKAVDSLIELASQSDISGTAVLVDTLVHTYCLNDEAENAETLAENATKMKLEGSPIRMWNTLLRHFAFQSNSSAVVRIQEKMKNLGVRPDNMTYAALMTALVVQGRTKDAAQILRSLHFKQALTVTPFHYAIILHGYAQEGNRDMTKVIYDEMKTRFPNLSSSARLSMLKMQSRRISMESTDHSLMRSRSDHKNYHDGTEALTEIMTTSVDGNLANQDPQPGFRRKMPNRNSPFAYMELLINGLTQDNHIEQAQKLIDKYEAMKDHSDLGSVQSNNDTSELLTARMMIAARQEKWDLVDAYWKEILEKSLQAAIPLQARIEPGNLPEAHSSSSVFSITQPITGDSITNSSDTNRESASDTVGISAPETTTKADSKVLPAQRYILSIPLTRYIQALDLQQKHDEIVYVVQSIQNTGFALSSKNWNSYVQALCKSNEIRHKISAFKTFQEIFITNVPPWKLLLRGKWVDRSASSTDQNSTKSVQLIDRKRMEKIKPGQMMPTYFTAVYLANALQKFQRLARKGYLIPLQTIQRESHQTYRYIKSIPYSRDRVQGILLRSREAREDFSKRPRQLVDSNRFGLLGSRSVVDQLSIDDLTKIEPELDADERNDLKGNCMNQGRKLELAEKYTGEIIRSAIMLPSKNRVETNQEMIRRIRFEESKKLKFIDQLQDDIKKDPMMSDPYQGDNIINIGQYDSPTRTIDSMDDPSSMETDTKSFTQEDPIDKKEAIPSTISRTYVPKRNRKFKALDTSVLTNLTDRTVEYKIPKRKKWPKSKAKKKSMVFPSSL